MKYFILFLRKLLRYVLKPLSFLPAILMMYLIFTFSAQDGTQSSAISSTVSMAVVQKCDQLFNLDLSEARTAHYAERIEHYVRKTAHVTEYFLLAVSVSFPLYVYKLRGFPLLIAAGLFCVGFAGLDEYHQSFVSGRSPSARDVAIDSIGIFTGIEVTRILGFIGRKTIFRGLSMEQSSRGKPADDDAEG